MPFLLLCLLPAPVVLLALLRVWIDYRLRRANEFLLFMHKGGLGDGFCQTGLMRALRAKHPCMRFIVITRYPELFAHLPEVSFVFDLSRHGAFSRWRVHLLLRVLRLSRAHDFVYKPQRQVSPAWREAHPGIRPHLVELAAAGLRLNGDFSDVRGSVVFSTEEDRQWRERYASLGEYAIVVPSGKTSYTPNKEWGVANYGAVVAALPGINWVRLGMAGDPALTGAVDLRGKTGVREMAWLLAHARFALCGEGLHNHLCGALGTPCFTVFSGFMYREIARYPATIPIVADLQPPCAPCMLKTPCPVPGRPCLSGITPAQVVARIRERMGLV